MKTWIATLLLLGTSLTLWAEPSGRHFIYAQYDFILTLELTTQKEAILNVVNFTSDTYALRPQQLAIVDAQGQAVKVDKIVIETGNPADPYLTSNMKILPNSFIGLVLRGAFAPVSRIQAASLRIGDQIFHLDPITELQFNAAADRIDRMNFDSPDIREDFRVLKMDFFGRREPAQGKQGSPAQPVP